MDRKECDCDKCSVHGSLTNIIRNGSDQRCCRFFPPDFSDSFPHACRMSMAAPARRSTFRLFMAGLADDWNYISSILRLTLYVIAVQSLHGHLYRIAAVYEAGS